MKGLELFKPELYYHIVNHAVGGENLFREDQNFQYFLQKYTTYTQTIWETYAYCLMPNHFHFLVKIHPLEKLATHSEGTPNIHKMVMQQFSNLLNAYAKAYNKMYNRKGALFMDFTKRFEVKSEDYLTAVIQYVHLNPVKHMFATSPEDWLYSSYRAVISNSKTLVKREEVLEWFGGKHAFLESHKTPDVSCSKKWDF